MRTRKPLVIGGALALVVLLVAGAVILARQTVLKPTTITAFFPTATAIYAGDEVRVAGVKVGTIDRIEPQGTETKLTMRVDRDVPIPADARAIIVAPNLVAARFVQLTPVYREGSGAVMEDGAEIPKERTGVPVEWDEVKTQLDRLATELGPQSGVSGTSVARFIDSAANALDGNGAKLRETLAQLSGAARILSEGSGNIVEIVKGLQTFVTALRDSSQQIVVFENRLATLTSVVEGSRTNLDAMLTDLSVAIGEVQRFVAGTRNETAEQVGRLANVTQVLVDEKDALRNILHVTPNAIANTLNMVNPNSGTPVGSIAFANASNPIQMICAMIGAVENVTGPETAKLCSQYLGPALRLASFNGMPFPMNPYLTKAPSPHRLLYSEERMKPGSTDQVPPTVEGPPAVSAYLGAGDVPPPPGWGVPPGPPGIYQPETGSPPLPQPAVYPGAPPANTTTAGDLLLPAGPAPGPAPAAEPAPGPLLPAEGTP